MSSCGNIDLRKGNMTLWEHRAEKISSCGNIEPIPNWTSSGVDHYRGWRSRETCLTEASCLHAQSAASQVSVIINLPFITATRILADCLEATTGLYTD